MKLIDMHCDTLMKLLEQPEKSLAELDAEVNLPGLKQAGSMAQFFSCFTNLMDYPQPPEGGDRKGAAGAGSGDQCAGDFGQRRRGQNFSLFDGGGGRHPQRQDGAAARSL